MIVKCANYVGFNKVLRNKWQDTMLFKFRTAVSTSGNSDEENRKKVWRKTSEERGEWVSSLRLFASEKKSNSGLIDLIQSPIDLRPTAIRRWLLRKRKHVDILEQSFVPERHETLGKELAAAHFILHRGGKIKLHNELKWYVGKDHELPTSYQPGIFVEAIDASNMNIYYEGLQNLFGLKYLKWLSFSNCKHIDDWCLDYISGELGSSLEYLDISSCYITERGLATLYRTPQLKFLNVSNIHSNKEFQLTCLLLEDLLNNLKIEGVNFMKI